MSELDLTLFATISAELAEGTTPARELLARFALDEAAWSAMSQSFGVRLAEDAAIGGALAVAFSRAFATHQDRLRALCPLTVEQWAALQADVESYDLPTIALTAHGMSLADYFRLVRHWATLLPNDPELAARYDAARASIELVHEERDDSAEDDAPEHAPKQASAPTNVGAPRR